MLRIARIVSVTDGGRIVNEKLARSQIIGGTVGGVGMTVMEETVTDPDPGTGRRIRSLPISISQLLCSGTAGLDVRRVSPGSTPSPGE